MIKNTESELNSGPHFPEYEQQHNKTPRFSIVQSRLNNPHACRATEQGDLYRQLHCSYYI